jgi:hypothetical protein
MSGQKRVYFKCEGVEAPLILRLQSDGTAVNLRFVADYFKLVNMDVKDPDGNWTTYDLAGQAEFRVPLQELQEFTGRRGDSLKQAFLVARPVAGAGSSGAAPGEPLPPWALDLIEASAQSILKQVQQTLEGAVSTIITTQRVVQAGGRP